MGKPWHRKDERLLRDEISVLNRRWPEMVIDTSGTRVHAHGSVPVVDGSGCTLAGYRMELIFPRDYPAWVPDLFMREPGVPLVGDRHIEVTGRACLCLPHEIPRCLPDGIRLEPFLDVLVRPWLLGQVHFDLHGKWPYLARSHEADGIVEGLAELFGTTDLELVARFLPHLVKAKPTKGHVSCPCGSGRKLRDCHGAEYRRIRSALPDHALRSYRWMLRG